MISIRKKELTKVKFYERDLAAEESAAPHADHKSRLDTCPSCCD